MGEIGISFYNAIYEMHNEKYYPWRTLPEGTEIICLNEIFETNLEEISKYLKAGELLVDEFYMVAEDELTDYYKENNIIKTDDEIFDEIYNFKFDGKFKEKVFSNATIEEHKLCVEFEPIYKDLYEKYKAISKKYNCQKEEILNANVENLSKTDEVEVEEVIEK